MHIEKITESDVHTFSLRTGEHTHKFVRDENGDLYTIVDHQDGCGPRTLTRIGAQGNQRAATKAEHYAFCQEIWAGRGL